jgi:hypothetical protein
MPPQPCVATRYRGGDVVLSVRGALSAAPCDELACRVAATLDSIDSRALRRAKAVTSLIDEVSAVGEAFGNACVPPWLAPLVHTGAASVRGVAGDGGERGVARDQPRGAGATQPNTDCAYLERQT